MAGSSWTNQLQNLLIIQTGSGATGLFIYNGTPKAGNGPVFWASESTTDPYGNTITPTAGVAGTGQFNAGNTIINANGIFTYSATPAANNLIASSTPAAGTDGFSNAYLQGEAAYFKGASQWTAIADQSITGGAQLAWYYTTGLTETGWILGGQLIVTAGVASPSGSPLQYLANGQGFIIGNGIAAEQLAVQGSVQLANVGTPAAKTGFVELYSSSGTTATTRQIEGGGADRVLDRSNCFADTHTVGNTTTHTAITDSYSIVANDAITNSVYVLETWGNGTNEAVQIGLSFKIDSTEFNAISIAGLSAGATFGIYIKAILQVLSATTACLHIVGQLNRTGIDQTDLSNSGSTFTATLASFSYDPTVSHTFQLMGWFASLATGQTMSTFGSMLTRKAA